MLTYCTKCNVVFFGMIAKEPGPEVRINGWLPYSYVPQFEPHCENGQVLAIDSRFYRDIYGSAK